MPQANTLEVVWSSGDDIPLVYVDNMAMIRIKDRFYLTFGHVRPPVGKAEGTARAELKPVGRFVIERDALKRITSVLNKHLADERME